MDSREETLRNSWYYQKYHPKREIQPVYQAVIDVSGGFDAITVALERPGDDIPLVLNAPAVFPPSSTN